MTSRTPMNILVVGGGGREHALVEKISESPLAKTIYACPGNGGIASKAICVELKATDIDGIVAFAREMKIDLVVVAPDDPLVIGLVDALTAAGITAFGPDKAAAAIEGSKVFSKGLMEKYSIPTAAYKVFSDPDEAMQYIDVTGTYPVVIKADGLAFGKGVIIAADRGEASEAIHSIMEDKAFGQSGNRIVIEEFLTGPEVSVLAFTDGFTVKPMISSMDHKRAMDGDLGPNTGGMGTIAPNPYYTEEIADACMENIFLPTIKAMAAEGSPFKGCLYFGLMLTPKGPTVIEYNCRFGDPEAQVVLPLLETDLVEVMLACIEGSLSKLDIRWKEGACACVIMASGGYPVSYKTGYPITGLDLCGQIGGATVYHAGTKLIAGSYFTAGGRVLGITGYGTSLLEALKTAYLAVEGIAFEGVFYRKDIGKK